MLAGTVCTVDVAKDPYELRLFESLVDRRRRLDLCPEASLRD